MSKHNITNKEKATTASFHLVEMDCKLAFVTLCLMKPKRWFHLEHNVAELNTDWLKLRTNLITWSHYKTEVIIIDAINIRKCFLPLFFQKVEYVLRYTNIIASSIDNGWDLDFSCTLLSINVIITWIMRCFELFIPIKYSLSFKSPLFHGFCPVWSICESLYFLKTSDAT